jgi:hypothetical protein
MTLIIDPDLLSQGAQSAIITDVAWTSSAGANTVLYSAGSNMPSWGVGEYIQVKEAFGDSNNDGLYVVRVVNVDTSNVQVSKVDGPSPVNTTAANAIFRGSNTTLTGNTATLKNVMINTDLRYIYLLPNASGNLIEADGATVQALYSFLKEQWKDDDTLNPHPFPLTAITPEQFEFIFDWEPRDFVPGSEGGANNITRKIMRTGGWREIDTADGSKLKKEYIGVITLGTFEDNNNDVAYYQLGTDPTDTGSTTDFAFAGPVNEAILTYNEVVPADTVTGFAFNSNVITRNDGGNWVTNDFRVGAQVTVLGSENTGENDGTYVITAVEDQADGNLQVAATPFTLNAADTTARFAVNYRNAITLFLRIRDGDANGKTYDQSTLADIGVSSVVNQVYRFPLTNATDLKISETDASIAANTPWTQILIRYFDQAFSRDVDGATNRDFGIVIDVGTFSGVDGATSAGGANLTTAEATIPSSTYDGGTIKMLEGTDEGNTFTILTAVGANVQLDGATFTASETNLSFVLQRSTPVVASLQEIYEKIQYLLRQASDIDSTDQTVTGKTADALLRFVGDNLECGQAIPNNPNGGGSGVIIEGFDSNDTNALTFYDNVGNPYNYPFVAAGSIAFNDNLVDDGFAEYWMFYTYTERFTNTGFGLSASSGSTATLDSSTTNLSTELTIGDYIALSGFTDPNNNGIWLVTGSITASTAAIRKINGDTVSNEAAGASISVDKNPINSPDAIIVNNNSGSPVTGTIGGSSVSFDYDYDNNVQGGRTAGSNAAITIRAIGLNTAQFVETTGTITRATGLSFSLVAGLERNYSNPTG